MIEKVHVKLEDPTELERSIYMLRCSIEGCYTSDEPRRCPNENP